ncbi:MAG: hypothetical protein C5B59_07640 [Bacteroidetes bacterium]|nr:MAG: hypothetical protein C5B59_07640 [Bacteroidota bacterium]
MGERKETRFFDLMGNPVASKATDYHLLVQAYDERDNKVSEAYFGTREEPVMSHNGISAIRYFYDRDNNQVRHEYLDTSGKLTSNIYGVTAAGREYSEGYLMKETRYDAQGQPTRAVAAGDGVSIIKYEYDPSGNRIREGFFDENGKPTNDQAGIQEIARFFSPNNMLTEVAYFDEFGYPCLDRNKIHSTKYVRDEKGRIIQEASYGKNYEPVTTYPEEVFMIKKKYDEYGRKISDSYWADSSTRMPHWEGSYETLTKFNDDGEPIEYRKLDANGAPFRAEDGSSAMKLVYDADGQLAERWFLYKDQLVSRKRGVTSRYSIIKYLNNSRGDVNELTFWDADRKPVDATVWIDDSIAAHRIVFIYRGSRIIEEKYYKAGATEPFFVLDCLKNDFLNQSGISTGRKNAN